MPHDNRSAFIATRLAEAQRTTIQRAAKVCNESLSTFTRQALTARAAGNQTAANEATAKRVRLSSNPARLAIKYLVALAVADPTAQIADLCLALGLPSDATADQIQAAVDQLLATLTPADGDPLQSNPDPAPVVPARLSAAKLAALTPAQRQVLADRAAWAQRVQRSRPARHVAARFEIGPDGNVRLARKR